MRKLLFALIFGLSLLAWAKKDETIDQLRQRAAAAETKKQPELYSELAGRELDAANEAYNTNPEQARSLIKNLVDSVEKATNASLESGKRLKKTEIDLRELHKRMEDISHTWSFEDRTPMKEAMDKVEAARSKLLDRMFEK